jgi:hypothetical protein
MKIMHQDRRRPIGWKQKGMRGYAVIGKLFKKLSMHKALYSSSGGESVY